MNNLQTSTAKAIVNIFETGRLLGNYGSVVVDPKDPGHLTYGRSQTTLASGDRTQNREGKQEWQQGSGLLRTDFERIPSGIEAPREFDAHDCKDYPPVHK